MITVVAAMGRNRVIGANGSMPWHIPADLAHFKQVTAGSAMVMGRKTFESIGRALPGRRSIVVTRNPDWKAVGAETVPSLTAGLSLAASDAADVFVIGGGEIYAQALPHAHAMVLTEIDAAPHGDTFFPAWSDTEWTETELDTRSGYAFVTYGRP